MKQDVRMLFTIRHKPKQIYCFMSQYSSIHHIITFIQHLLQWRNFKHTAPPRTSKILKAKETYNVMWRNDTDVSSSDSYEKNGINSMFS